MQKLDFMVVMPISNVLKNQIVSVPLSKPKSQLSLLLGKALKTSFENYKIAKSERKCQKQAIICDIKCSQKQMNKNDEENQKQLLLNQNQQKTSAVPKEQQKKQQVQRQIPEKIKKTQGKQIQVSIISQNITKNFSKISIEKSQKSTKKITQQPKKVIHFQEDYEEVVIPLLGKLSKTKLISKKMKLIKRKVQKWQSVDSLSFRGKRQITRLLK